MEDTSWICTDPDTQQYGRRVSYDIYQFKQPDINNGDPVEIDKSRYSMHQIEECINSYGYTIIPDNGKSGKYIYELYGEEADWVISECLFEMEEKPE